MDAFTSNGSIACIHPLNNINCIYRLQLFVGVYLVRILCLPLSRACNPILNLLNLVFQVKTEKYYK